jgi:hypothetical protein
MKNLFLLFACLIMVLLLKELPKKKEQLVRIDIVKSHVVDFSGVLFLPKTLQADHELVNSSFIKINIAGKNYRYVQCQNSYCLVGTAREVSVSAGDKVEVSFPTKLFFAKEVE